MREPRLRYHDIAQELRRRIVDGIYRLSDALPSQSALADEFDTTVMTVRQALRLLENEGLVESRHGIGSFVTGLNEEHRGFELSSFRGALGDASGSLRTVVLDRTESVRNDAAARALGLDSSLVSMIVRLRVVDEIPVVYQESCVVPANWSVLRDYEPGSSLYAALGRQLQVVISRATESLTVETPPPNVAHMLGLPTDTACFFSERVSMDAGGSAVLFDYAFMRSDRVSVSLSRNGNTADLRYVIRETGSSQ